MRRIFYYLTFLIIFLTSYDSIAATRVRGYFRKDGTYVAPHYRSAPDGNFWNNWSTKGNVNPYTGKPGTKVSPPGSSHFRSNPNISGGSLSQPTKSLPIPNTNPRDSETERIAKSMKYWEDRGHDVSKYNPQGWNSYNMDAHFMEVERMNRHRKFWENRGHHVPRYNAPFRDSYSMDAHFMEVERKAEVAERMK